MKLEKLVFELENGSKIELSPEDAKNLHRQLDGLFGEKITYKPYWNSTWTTNLLHVEAAPLTFPQNAAEEMLPTTYC